MKSILPNILFIVFIYFDGVSFGLIRGEDSNTRIYVCIHSIIKSARVLLRATKTRKLIYALCASVKSI